MALIRRLHPGRRHVGLPFLSTHFLIIQNGMVENPVLSSCRPRWGSYELHLKTNFAGMQQILENRRDMSLIELSIHIYIYIYIYIYIDPLKIRYIRLGL